MRHILTNEDRSRGGKNVRKRKPPKRCLRCGRSMEGKGYMSYLGHLGLHGLADKYFNGDLSAAQKRLRENGIARGDPCPSNRAWKEYKPITEGE